MKSDLVILFILALFIRLLAAWPQQQPNYMDAAYSYVNAVNLAEGRGFVEDFVWNYLDSPEPPPRPSHLYWMPLTSIFAWLGMLAGGGTTYRAAQVAFVFFSALLAPIAYYIAFALSLQRWQRWLAGFLAIFSGFYFPFWTAIDNFTPFAVAGSLALLFAWRGVEMMNDERGMMNDGHLPPASYQLLITNYQTHLIIAGIFVGFAHLARADGLLLLIAIISVYLLHLIFPVTHFTHPLDRARDRHASRLISYALRFTILLMLGYLIVMLPWFIRNWQVVGTPLPGSGTQSIWLTTYDDLFSYSRELSPQTFFAQGLGPVLWGRWSVFITNFQTVFAVWGMIFLGPLALVGAWHLRRHLLIQLAAMYALLLFVVMTFVFAFPGARGGLFHSGAALLPFIYAAAVMGLDSAVDWVAARRRGWKAQTAKQVFGVGLIVMAMALSSFIYYQRVLRKNAWNNADSLYPEIVAWITQQNPTGMVMIGNPPAYRYHGGGLSVIVPNEDIKTTLQAAGQYQVDYLILDGNHPAPLAELYDDPTQYSEISLVQIFAEDSEKPIYVFEISK